MAGERGHLADEMGGSFEEQRVGKRKYSTRPRQSQSQWPGLEGGIDCAGSSWRERERQARGGRVTSVAQQALVVNPPHVRTCTRRPMCTPFYASVHFNTVRKQCGPSVGDQEEIASRSGEVGASCWEEGVKTTRVDPV